MLEINTTAKKGMMTWAEFFIAYGHPFCYVLLRIIRSKKDNPKLFYFFNFA